ncbi:pentapeptide repeat-containing protein [Rhizobium sp. BK456]|uniref:pentapeptide repeat-containing protein n=1 Tax=Rhizobium sp. BK456 TaxID=2587007 RepID=UPI001611C71F|nr:pentapeptide repeat-containing protein [Rhizobium sp. BK456]MBB3521092.1 hypothetical protein [Rhizobium sp. BK456]
MKFDVLDRYTGEVKFTADIECKEDALPSLKLGLAVKWAIKGKADLRSANLRSADLSSANLRSANLRSADLSSANLSSANLSYADLSSANLSYANLRSADLRSADLRSANLRSADLRSANLRSADLSYADLRSADLRSAENAEMAVAMTRILPEGDLIGWKKCRNGVIVKLRIPETAKRSHAFGRKCRAEYADVIEVIGEGKAISLHDGKTEYIAGTRVTPDSFDENWFEECSSGIHFFITRLEAEAYV